MDNLTLVQALIPVAVPLLIAALKWGVKYLPTWLPPILAPVLGGLIDAATVYLAGGTYNPIVGMVLGSAGVGLRELVDQMKKTTAA